MRLVISVCALLTGTSFGQSLPNLDGQRAAMRKLNFLVGKWSGEGVMTRGPGGPMKVTQTEDVQFKLDGLLLLIEGVLRDSTGLVVARSFSTISYDAAVSKYRIRSYDDGRYFEADFRITASGFEWVYEARFLRVKDTALVNAVGEWAETRESSLPTAAVAAGFSETHTMLDVKLRRRR
jgi:hypothetical protein